MRAIRVYKQTKILCKSKRKYKIQCKSSQIQLKPSQIHQKSNPNPTEIKRAKPKQTIKSKKPSQPSQANEATWCSRPRKRSDSRPLSRVLPWLRKTRFTLFPFSLAGKRRYANPRISYDFVGFPMILLGFYQENLTS